MKYVHLHLSDKTISAIKMHITAQHSVVITSKTFHQDDCHSKQTTTGCIILQKTATPNKLPQGVSFYRRLPLQTNYHRVYHSTEDCHSKQTTTGCIILQKTATPNKPPQDVTFYRRLPLPSEHILQHTVYRVAVFLRMLQDVMFCGDPYGVAVFLRMLQGIVFCGSPYGVARQTLLGSEPLP